MINKNTFLKNILLSIEKNINLNSRKYISYKADKGYTSILDIKINNYLYKNIKSNFPNDLIISEEDLDINNLISKKNVVNRDVWIIDPLCGTTNQVRQIPFFANSISLIKANKEIISAIYDVNRAELFYTDSKKTYLNNKTVTVSKVKKLKDAVVSINCNQSATNRKKTKIENLIKKLAPPITRRVKIFESANLELAYVSCGRIDIYFNPDDKLWDIVAGSQLIKNSGGNYKVMQGNIMKPFLGVKGVIASNKFLHRELLEAIK